MQEPIRMGCSPSEDKCETSATEFNKMKGRYSAKNTIKRQEIAERVLLIVIARCRAKAKSVDGSMGRYSGL
jgi:hypothetical protein